MLLSKRRGTGCDSVKLRRHAALLPTNSTRTAPGSRSGTDDEPVGQSGASSRREPAIVVSAAGTDGGGELTQDRHGHVPAHAGVGDALADGEVAAVGEILAAVDEETFHHDADDAEFADRDLLGDGAGHGGLASEVLAASISGLLLMAVGSPRAHLTHHWPRQAMSRGQGFCGDFQHLRASQRPLTRLFQDTQFPLIRVSPACVPGQRRLACDGRATRHRAGWSRGIHGRRSLRYPDPFTYDTIADVLLTLEYTALQIGFWELTLPNDQQTQDRLKNGVIENVLLAITYAGQTRCGLHRCGHRNCNP
jgi:hypothetical protein